MRILSIAGGTLRHGLAAVTEAALIVGVVAALVVGAAVVGRSDPAGAEPALAATSTSAVWIDELTTARSSGLQYGDGFNVGYRTRERQPWAQARCYPNGSTVFDRTYADGSIWGENFSVYPGGPMPQGFELTDPIANNWTAGGADCVLRLVKYSSNYSRYTVLATKAFTVAP